MPTKTKDAPVKIKDIPVASPVDIASRFEEIMTSSNKSQDKISKAEQLLNRRITGRTKFLFEKAMELADGIFILKDDDPLKIKYYKKAPDLDAIKYLMDRLFGKPVARVEKREEKKGIMVVEHIIKNLANPTRALPETVNEDGTAASSNDMGSGEDAL